MHLFLSLLLLLVVYIISVITKPVPESGFDYDGINTLISFGDSYTTRFLHMDSLTYDDNCTSAGGPNWVIYLSESTEWVSWDFAYNSAPVDNTIVRQDPSVIDVKTQVQELYPKVFVTPTEEMSAILNSKYSKDKIRTPKSTLVTIWVGINDIDITFDWKDTETIDVSIMEQYESLINQLIAQGISQFMLMNVPPIHLAPLWHKTTNESIIKSRVGAYNERLKNMVLQLKRFNPSAEFFEHDTYSFFKHVLEKHKKYDFTEVNTFCPDWSNPDIYHCKPKEEYFWLNDLHPTFRVHELLSQDIQHFLGSQ